jgi:hypothetical protein
MDLRKIIYTLIIVTLSSNYSIGQSNNLTIFDSTRTYWFDATFIDCKGNTLTREKIKLKPLGIPWEFQESQTKYEITYFPTDSVIDRMRNPSSKKKRKWEGIVISTKNTSGATEDSSGVWTHPLRKNQYMYTEVCAFPEVRYDKLEVGKRWDGSTLFILFGWGRFKGKVSHSYLVEKKLDYNFNGEQLTECWQILGTGVHNKLGTSTVRYVFHRKYGFLEFNYEFFDGTKIHFKLNNIQYSKP